MTAAVLFMGRAVVLLLTLVLAAPVPSWGAGADDVVNSEERITLVAERQEVEGDVWRGTGGVRILYQDIRVQCEEMEYNRVTQDLVARGNVVLDQGPTRFTADEMYFNLGTKTGMFVNGEGFVPPMYTFSGSEVEKLDETHYRIDRGAFTTCESDDDTPPWGFTVRKARLEEEGYGRFHSVAMRVQGVPVFYLPYLVWPVKRERSPGLLMPSFGYSTTFGTYLGLPVYLPLGRSYDTTVRFDYFSKGAFGLANEWRWAPVPCNDCNLELYAIWDPNIKERYPELEEWQWRVNGRHDQDDFYGFRLLAEVEALSDIDFFQELERDFDASTRRDLYSYLYLTRSWGPYALNVRADHRTTFLTTNDVTLAQLPEVELRVRSSRIGRTPLYWDLISSVNYFNVDRGGDLAGDYLRADVFPTVSYSLPSPLWLSVTPRLGGRATYYTARYAEDRSSFVDESIERTYIAGGVDVVGPSISRVFSSSSKKFSRFKHLIEPRVEYAYLGGTEDTSQIPVFDEVDSTVLTNRARMVLSNRLLGRSREGVSARELGAFELYQDYSFSDPLNTGVDRESQFGALGALLRLVPTEGTGFDARLSYDTLYDNLRSTSLAASVRRPYGSVNLTWYQSFNPLDGESLSSQIRTIIGFRKQGFPFRANLQFAYDIERSEFQQQQIQLNWEGSCWSIGVEYRDLQLGLYPTRDWLIRISLKGIGALPEIRGSLSPVGN
jgi:LPS-assembly protein